MISFPPSFLSFRLRDMTTLLEIRMSKSKGVRKRQLSINRQGAYMKFRICRVNVVCVILGVLDIGIGLALSNSELSVPPEIFWDLLGLATITIAILGFNCLRTTRPRLIHAYAIGSTILCVIHVCIGLGFCGQMSAIEKAFAPFFFVVSYQQLTSAVCGFITLKKLKRGSASQTELCADNEAAGFV